MASGTDAVVIRDARVLQRVAIDERAEFRGAPACAGLASGRARVVRGPEDSDSVRPGDVVVCVEASTTCLPLLSIAAGIVTETGGALSNLATCARERDVPMVVDVKNATTRIRNGQRIELDGATGVVSLRD